MSIAAAVGGSCSSSSSKGRVDRVIRAQAKLCSCWRSGNPEARQRRVREREKQNRDREPKRYSGFLSERVRCLTRDNLVRDSRALVSLCVFYKLGIRLISTGERERETHIHTAREREQNIYTHTHACVWEEDFFFFFLFVRGPLLLLMLLLASISNAAS